MEEYNGYDNLSHEELLAENNLEKWSLLQITVLNNAISFAMQLGWTIARNEVWEGDKNIDASKVENYLREEPCFRNMPEESIQHFIEVILHVID